MNNTSEAMNMVLSGEHTSEFCISKMTDNERIVEIVNSLSTRIMELEKICHSQQTTIAIQADKINVLDKIFQARRKSDANACDNKDSCEFVTYPLPIIGHPEE